MGDFPIIKKSQYFRTIETGVVDPSVILLLIGSNVG
jgi:hypothetical protein